jgi:CheY-like chemotaxis protein
VVDDDMMSREVIAMLVEDSGFQVDSFESGESALEALSEVAAPAALLVDMQMPGLSGDTLAAKLRAACGPGTCLVAMSGTGVPAEQRQEFDEFLLKPFSAEELRALLGACEVAGPVAAEEVAGLDETMLSRSTFLSLRQTMPTEQLNDLYTMCLDDVEARLVTLRQASADREADQFRAAAHSIKGGCGMVGAVELARLAAEFEKNGMPVVHTVVPFEEFLQASARLRGMLRRVLNDL